MLKDKARKNRKTSRNQALLQYVVEHPDATYQEIGDQFNISRQRAWEIIDREERKKAEVETTA